MCPPLRDNLIRDTARHQSVAVSRAHRESTGAETHVTVVPNATWPTTRLAHHFEPRRAGPESPAAPTTPIATEIAR